MKTTLKNTVAILIMALLPALLGAAQAGAVDYQTKYKGTMYNVQSTTSYGVAAPVTTFQSTSAYASPEWAEESATPMLNADGSVDGSAYMGGAANAPAGPRRAPVTGPGTPGGQLNPSTQQPLGDGLMALMLCACAYLIVRATRKEEKIG